MITSLLEPLRFGTILIKKKGIRSRVMSQNGPLTELLNLKDNSVYTVPTDQFMLMNQPVDGQPDVFESKGGQWRDFKIVPRGTIYRNTEGKRHKTEHGILIRELGNANAYYEPSIYYAAGVFSPEKGNPESEKVHQEILNIGHIHGPVSPSQVRGMAKTLFYNRPYVFSLAGYSDADKGYERSTGILLNALVSKLGPAQMGFVTSPTAVANSIDATGTLLAQKYNIPIVYVTAEGYIQYIDLKQLAKNIDKAQFTLTPKFFGKTSNDYSKATAEASTICTVMGGRNAAVADAVNALKKGNKLIIFRDKVLTRPAWDPVKNRVDNASQYLVERIEAYQKGLTLPYSLVGALTPPVLQDIEKEYGSLDRLIKVIDVDTTKQNVKSVVKRLGKDFMYFLTI